MIQFSVDLKTWNFIEQNLSNKLSGITVQKARVWLPQYGSYDGHGHYADMMRINLDNENNKIISYMDQFVYIEQTNSIILSDYKYWTNHEEQLKLWCSKHGAKFQGMLIQFANNSDITLFLLEFNV